MEKHRYYITEHGEVVSTSFFLGEFEDMHDAKLAAFEKMGDGDSLLEFPADVDPMTEDYWGYEFADPDQATDMVMLRRTDDSIENVPAGKWFWDGESENYEEFFNRDGTAWDGKDEAEAEDEPEDDYEFEM